MNTAELTFRRLFVGLGETIDFAPAELEWKDLHERRSKITRAITDMLKKCERDARNPNEDELAAYSYGELLINSINKEMDDREARGDKSPQGRTTPRPGVYGAGVGADYEPRIGEIGLRYSELFKGKKDATLSRGDFKSFREFLEVAASGKYDARAMTTGLSDGGAQVPEFWAREIYDTTMEESVCLGRCRVYPMQSGILHIPMWNSEDHTDGPLGSFAASWLEETGPATEVNPKMKLLTLTAKKLGIYCSASREVLEDGLSLSAQISPVLRQSLAWSMDQAIISGSGVARPMGIMNSPSAINVNRASAGAIAYTDVMNMYTRLLPSMVAGAQWIVSPSALRQLLAMVDGASHYIWVPAATTGVAQAVPGYLLGLPVYISEKASALGSKGDLILTNLNAYALGMRSEIIVEKSNAPFWSQDLMSFRVIVRFDGHPLLSTAITPANGGDTLSWAVILDTP